LEKQSWSYRESKTALLSTREPEKIIDQCRRLVNLGWRLIATRETTEVMQREKIPIIDISQFTGIGYEYGIPPTLHPKIEQALTEKCEEMIDLVFDVPYSLTQGNDVGGRTLLALGAKGKRLVINNYNDLEMVVNLLEQENTNINSVRNQLIAKVNLEISRHFLLVSKEYSKQYEGILSEHKMVCEEGENPYQIPCDLFIFDNKQLTAISGFSQLSGERLNFTNIADMDSIIVTIEKLKQVFSLNKNKVPFIVVAAKHGNPCGVGVDWTSKDEAINKALWGNPQAIWGGEVICNFKIDDNLAKVLLKSDKRENLYGSPNWMLDLIISPEFSVNAISFLGKVKHRKLISSPAIGGEASFLDKWRYRFVNGGYLRQKADDYILELSKLNLADSFSLDADSIFIAWAVSYSSFHGGNEVSLAKDSMLIAVGGGPSTIIATQHAIQWAKSCNHKTKDAVFCADAFFPFMDAPEILKQAECKGGVVPAGGRNHNVVQKYFKDNLIEIGFIPEQYRGFCRH
jgi:phosphoribosylaminoimidazolecarboxamide formyltransferase/IMP cyclohydrolase